MNNFRTAIAAVIIIAVTAIVAHAGARTGGTTIHAFSKVAEGHGVGGIAIDEIGNIYVADFGETVMKFSPEGHASELATGLYGASGNAIDSVGNLLQSNFYRDSITKIDRLGHSIDLVATGLSGPVGIAVERSTGRIFIADCRSNLIKILAGDGKAVTFAKSELFACPNGLAFNGSGDLFVVNYRDNRMLRVTPSGEVSLFATVSKKGLGHLCYKSGHFYVTAYASHELYDVADNGSVKRILGSGQRGLQDGDASDARLSFPNGIACHPWAPKLFINEYINDTDESLPRRSIVREVDLAE